jgi:hypothetical protein
MKHLVSVCLLALAGVVSLPSPAAAALTRSSQGEELPSAREVIQRYATAANLKTALEKTRSMHVVGTVSVPSMGLEGAMEIWSAKPNLRISSMEVGGFGKIVTGFDGKVGWMTQPMMGARLLSGTELLQAKLEASYDNALKPESHYESARTVARQTFEGKDCWVVEVVAKPLDAAMDADATRAVRTSKDFYEIATGLLLGTEGRQEGEMGSGPFTTVFTGYKDFGGQLLPTKTSLRAMGQEFVIEIGSVEFDTAGAATFTPPLEVQKLIEAAAAPKAKPAGEGPKPQ